MSRLGRQCHSFFEFMKRTFFLEQIGDIHAGPDIAAEVPARSITRDSLIGNPTIFSVVPLQAILHNERFACIESATIGLQSFLYIIRMECFTPAVAKVLLHASPSEFNPSFVDVGAK